MKTKSIFSTILLVLLHLVSYAQVSFQTEVKKRNIGINQRIEVSFTMNEDGDNFSPPAFDQFTVVGGPMQSYNTMWVNGNRSFKKSYTYSLAPKKKGTLTIGAATIEINGKVYKTQPVTIVVGDAVDEPQRPSRMQGWSSFFDDDDEPPVQQAPINPKNIGKGIFLVAEVSNSSPYLNEPIAVTYKLYVSHESGIRAMQLLQTPKFTNFWNHTVPEKNMQVKLENYKGKEYRMAVVQKTVLMPQKEGKLILDPLEFEMVVEEATGRFDVFRKPELLVSNKRFSTGTQVINVKPLPLENQPQNFTGAVGQYHFTAQVNKNTVKANEPIELLVKATGKGNLQLFTLPKATASQGLELYTPEATEKTDNDIQAGMSGYKSDKYAVVPQYKGKYTIEPLDFSYFDPVEKKYKTITTAPIEINVLEGPDLPTNASEQNQLNNTSVFHDIRSRVTEATPKTNSSFMGSTLFYCLLLSPLLVLPLLIVWDKKRTLRLQDVAGNKMRFNQKLAKKYLGEAKKKMGQKEAFYEALERCLHNYLKARLHIETSEMSEENIAEFLENKGIDQNNILSFLALKSTCEKARYSPFDVQSMHNDFDKAVEIIAALEKQLKA